MATRTTDGGLTENQRLVLMVLPWGVPGRTVAQVSMDLGWPVGRTYGILISLYSVHGLVDHDGEVPRRWMKIDNDRVRRQTT